MLSYKDRTFCISPDCENKCGRKLTDKIVKDAERWWGGEDVPISVDFFCGGEKDE